MTGQRGQVYKLGASWAYRYRTANGKRPQKSGFRTRGEARAALEEELRRLRLGSLYRPDATIGRIVEEFYATYARTDPNTVGYMHYHTDRILAAFRDVRAAELAPVSIARWRRDLTNKRSAHQTLTVFRQILGQAVLWGWVERNVAEAVPNPRPRRPEVSFFATWQHVDQLAVELGPDCDGGAIIVVGCGTGLRPEELFGLDWPDIDLERRVLTVRRVYVGGIVKPYGKTEGSRRSVPLRSRVVDALAALPGHHSGPVFHGERGGRVRLSNWHRRSWAPGLDAAGLAGVGQTGHLTPYSMRHTYAAWSLAAGVNIFSLSRRMGTSVRMISSTYGHLTHDADVAERDLLDAWDTTRGASEPGHGLDTEWSQA